MQECLFFQTPTKMLQMLQGKPHQTTDPWLRLHIKNKSMNSDSCSLEISNVVGTSFSNLIAPGKLLLNNFYHMPCFYQRCNSMTDSSAIIKYGSRALFDYHNTQKKMSERDILLILSCSWHVTPPPPPSVIESLCSVNI